MFGCYPNYASWEALSYRSFECVALLCSSCFCRHTHTHNIWWYGDGVVQLNFFLVDLRVVFVYMLLLNWLFLQFAQIRSNSRAAPYEWKIETNAKQLLFHGLALFGCSWMGNDCYWLDLAWVSRNARKVSAIWNVCIEKFEEVYYIIQLHTQAHAADP